MEVDERRFFEEGFLIVRQAVPAGRLGELRLMAEVLVDRCKSRSEAGRESGGPLGGAWYASI